MEANLTKEAEISSEFSVVQVLVGLKNLAILQNVEVSVFYHTRSLGWTSEICLWHAFVTCICDSCIKDQKVAKGGWKRQLLDVYMLNFQNTLFNYVVWPHEFDHIIKFIKYTCMTAWHNCLGSTLHGVTTWIASYPAERRGQFDHQNYTWNHT